MSTIQNEKEINQKLTFLSTTKDLTSGDSSSGILLIDDLMNGKYELEYFSCTNLLYNINSYNNQFTITFSSVNYPITITQGFYSLIELATKLSTLLTNFDGSSHNITVISDSNSSKLTFTNSGGAFTMTFSDSYNTNYLLGFAVGTTSSSSSITSTYPCDLFPYKSIFLRFNEIQGYHLQGPSHFNTSFMLNFGNSFNEPYIYRKHNEIIQHIHLNTPRNVEFYFHDEFNNKINLNNAQWQIVLREVQGKKPEDNYKETKSTHI